MGEVISADTFLALLLNVRERISFKELRNIRDKVESKYKSLSVDISIPSIEKTLFYYPEMFFRKDREIFRAEHSEKYFDPEYIKNEFLVNMPAKIVNDISSLLIVT